MTHAFFKGLLFLGGGSVMHAMSGELDMRKMGGLRKKIPVTYWTCFFACLAIAGFPGFSGFFSKDEILWMAYSKSGGNIWPWLIGAVTAGLTAFYMFRMFFNTFHGGAGHLRK
jgi:NADH-quinone oxidoreductase subunit L